MGPREPNRIPGNTRPDDASHCISFYRLGFENPAVTHWYSFAPHWRGQTQFEFQKPANADVSSFRFASREGGRFGIFGDDSTQY